MDTTGGHIDRRPLTRVTSSQMMALMNDPDVRRHLPLAREAFGVADYERFLQAKQQIWETHGFGPWSFFLGDEFMGWGGHQPEGEDIDIALVLHRAHWGAGRVLYRHLVDSAFDDLNAGSVITLLPPSRTRVGAVLRLGFRTDGQVLIAGQPFNRYRLSRADRTTATRARSSGSNSFSNHG